jgi:hypothetical protein
MSQKSSNQTLHLLKIGDQFKIEFEGETDLVEIIGIGSDEEDAGVVEYFEVLISPGCAYCEFYAELYLEDLGVSWNFAD